MTNPDKKELAKTILIFSAVETGMSWAKDGLFLDDGNTGFAYWWDMINRTADNKKSGKPIPIFDLIEPEILLGVASGSGWATSLSFANSALKKLGLINEKADKVWFQAGLKVLSIIFLMKKIVYDDIPTMWILHAITNFGELKVLLERHAAAVDDVDAVQADLKKFIKKGITVHFRNWLKYKISRAAMIESVGNIAISLPSWCRWAHKFYKVIKNPGGS